MRLLDRLLLSLGVRLPRVRRALAYRLLVTIVAPGRR